MCSKGRPLATVLGPTSVPLPQPLAPLAFLIGTWRGKGRGYYPTIDNFQYEEEVSFGHVGKPFLSYTQRTWALNEARTPMHTESGYIRPVPSSNKLEFVMSDPTGLTHIYEGEVDADKQRLEFRSSHLGRTPTAKEVKEVRRVLWCTQGDKGGKVLNYELHMAAVGQPMQQHLDAILEQMIEAITYEQLVQHTKQTQGDDDLKLVDVREKAEFASVHLPGAVNLPLGELIATTEENETLQQLKGKDVVLYCDSGYRAHIALYELKKKNITARVRYLDGAWPTESH